MASGVTVVGFGIPVTTPPAAPTVPVRPAATIQGSPESSEVAAATGGGNNSPSKGQALPPAQTGGVSTQGDLIQLQSVVQGVNQFLRETQRQILFQFDPRTDKSSVTIVNPATGEIIRQIPVSQAITTGETLQQAGLLSQGLIIDESA